MATLTIRNLPEEVVSRIKKAAHRNGHSMEQEVRELIEIRFAAREKILARVRGRWGQLPKTSAASVKTWRTKGRR